MRIAIVGIAAAIFCAWSTVLYAWAEDRTRRTRQYTITAQAALRRRIDRELADIRAALGAPAGWPAAEPNPVIPGDDTPTGPIPRPVPHKRDDSTDEMGLGAHIDADHRALTARTAEEKRRERTAAWVDEELTRFTFADRPK